jgi:SAM-dependent methyltransferase
VKESESVYVHGTAPAEQRRLAALSALLDARELALLHLRGDERVLELGAGLGIFARVMSRTLGAGEVVAVEQSPAQIARGRELAREAGEEALVDWRAGDALAPPLAPGEWGSFDVAHARFLAEHLQRPDELAAVMVRAVRPGGRIVLCDDDHPMLVLDPPAEGVAELWQCYWNEYHRLGNDPLVGRRLVSLLVGAGAEIVRTETIHFGGAHGEAHFEVLLENLIGVIESARERLIASRVIDAASFAARIRVLRQWGTRRDAVLWYPLPWTEARRPVSG